MKMLNCLLIALFTVAALITPQLSYAAVSENEDWLIISIVSIAALFVLGIIAIALLGPQVLLRSTMRQRTELINKLLESGKPVPPELLEDPKPPSPLPQTKEVQDNSLSRTRSLRKSVSLFSWGVGISAVFYFGFESPRAATWGLLFIALSLGSFINAKYFSEEEPTDN